MLTFSLNTKSGDDVYAEKVWDTIQRNMGYFRKFNRDKYEEAAQRAYLTAINNRKDGYADLDPYIKKLAREIMKVSEHERPYDIVNENGEVAHVFTSLTESMSEDSLHRIEEIYDHFKEFYLINTDEFMKLINLFKYDDVVQLKDVENFEVKDAQLKQRFQSIMRKYGANLVFKSLYNFFNDLDKLTKPVDEYAIQEIVMKEAEFRYTSKIPDVANIVDSKGNFYGIDKTTLTMPVDVDYIEWDTAFNTNCNILKIDISPLMNYMYEEIYVSPGVFTRHVTWCGDKYKLTSPGGYTTIDTDRDKFMNTIRIELIINLLMNNINKIIAVSPDHVYIKPTRATDLSTIRLKLVTGKIIDLPVTVHIIKRHHRS